MALSCWKNLARKLLGVLGASAAAAAVIFAGGGATEAAPGGTDAGACRAAGNYVEFCSCERVCETVLTGAAPGKCAFVAALRVEAGQRGETSLGSLAVAIVGAPGAGRDDPGRGAIYVDRRANPAQVEALARAVLERFGERIGGAVAAPKPALLHVERSADAVAIGIEGVAELKARPLTGAFHRLVQLQHAPGMVFPVLFVAQGTGGKVSDPTTGVRFDGEGRAVLYGKFDMGGGPPRKTRR
jgi:hypothetical protein